MKKIILTLIATLTIFTNEAEAAWPTVPTLSCWSYGTGKFMKAQINPEGNGFFTVSSILINNGKLKNVGGGTAFIKGNLVYWAQNFAGNDQVAMWTSQSYLLINKNTLVGQLKSISHDKNYADGSLDTQYESNPITFTPVSCSLVGW